MQAILIEHMRHAATHAEMHELPWEAAQLREGAAEIERLQAENDALARETLTPEVFQRLLEWLRAPRPASAAFTAGIERQIAYALESDVLPEVKRMRQRIERLRGMLKTNAGWWYDVNDDDKGDACIEAAEDMEPRWPPDAKVSGAGTASAGLPG